MKKEPSIAIYSGEIPSTTFIERLIEGVSERGCTVYLFGVISKKNNYNPKVKVLGYKQHKLYKLMYLLRYTFLLILKRPTEKKRLDQFLATENRTDLYSKVKYYPVLYYCPDLFHLQWAKGIAEWAWVEDFGMKLVLSLRGAHINYSPIADRELAETYTKHFPSISGFHAVSKAIAKEAEMYGAKPNKVTVVYSGLQKNDLVKSEKPKNAVYQIISVGRPHWIKGYRVALDACKQLKDAGVSFFYTIVGAANDMELMYQIYVLGLEDCVRLTKKQPFITVQQLMFNADLLLLSSHKEGVANVVLEAMSLETLVLTTNCGGMNEVIEDGANGFLVPIRDAILMAQKMKRIMDLSEHEIATIRQNALNTIEEQHTEAQMVNGMLSFYNNALKDQP
ncbi:MAG: glycosyltransferase [Psychroserpens sp.]|uniref:glycosyltransferase n=1 Tax=Psychroserpens sp. TaxID=2020870 RepID=UPI003CB6AB67